MIKFSNIRDSRSCFISKFLKFRNNKNKKSSALLNTIVFLSILTIIGLAIASLTLMGFKYISRAHKGAQALNIAEAGIDKALYELNKPDSVYKGEDDTPLDDGTFSIRVEDGAENTKIITSTGYIPTSTNYEIKKTVKVVAKAETSSTSIAFNYAVQIGDQGLVMNANSRINGNAYSNGNIIGYSNSIINGDAYAVGTISLPKPQVTGTKKEGVSPSEMPTIDYDFWKNEAAKGGEYQGNYNVGGNNQKDLGPLKIVGYFKIDSNASVTLKGPIYVTGDFEMNSNSHLYLDQSFGSTGTVIIVDGRIKLNSNSYIYPTDANPKGYILLVSTSTSDNAIELNSNSSTGICYALNGGTQVNSNGTVVALVSKKLTLNSNATFNYDKGLADSRFTTGPGGKWIIKPGSWQKL